MKRSKRIVCWDLDETLGCFRPAEANRFMRHLPEKRGVVPGMKPLLEDLSSDGCVNVVTTGAPAGYAEAALDKYGLSGYFESVFDYSIVCPGNGFKRYRPVAERFGISESEIPDRIIAIGNEDRDIPKDLPVVFVYHPMSMKFDASPLRMVLEALGREGSWRRGFRSLDTIGGERIDTECFDGSRLRISDVELAAGRLLAHPVFDISLDSMVLILSASEIRKKELE